jgi:ADP-ribosylglycohydrolase
LATASGHHPADHFTAGLVLAVKHGGEHGSAGSIAGSLLGATYGEAALPQGWLGTLEGIEVIRGMAESMVGVFGA